MKDSANIAHAITTRLSEDDCPSAYAIANELGVKADAVYALRDGKGSSIANINNILESLDLVIVPRACVTKLAIQLGYVERKGS